jgi:hypothetical protein
MYSIRKENNAIQSDTNPYFEDKNKKESYISDNVGSKVKQTRFSDGSSIVHFGGPCGSSRFDECGEEC